MCIVIVYVYSHLVVKWQTCAHSVSMSGQYICCRANKCACI